MTPTAPRNRLLQMNGYGLLGARLHVGRSDGKLVGTVFARNITNALANLGTNSFSEAVTRSVAKPLWYGGSTEDLLSDGSKSPAAASKMPRSRVARAASSGDGFSAALSVAGISAGFSPGGGSTPRTAMRPRTR